jgi:cytochrome b
MARESSPGTRIAVWDLPLRLFHWLLVAAVAIALLSAEEDSPLNHWHVMAGWTAGILIVFRIVWGFVGGEHSRFAGFLRPASVVPHVRELLRGRAEPSVGHNPLGALSVLALLALVALTVWTGVTLREDLHEILGWTLLALVAVHIVAVIIMSVLTKENLPGAMITGTKPGARHPGAADARRPGWLALAIAVAVVAAAAWAVLAYDPLAFTPRSAEAYEHRMEGKAGRAEGDERRKGREHEDEEGR